MPHWPSRAGCAAEDRVSTARGCVRQVVQFQIHGCGCDRLGGGPQFFLLFFQKLHIQVAMILEPALVGFGTEGSDQT